MSLIKKQEIILDFLRNHLEIQDIQKTILGFIQNVTYLKYKIIKILIFNRN